MASHNTINIYIHLLLITGFIKSSFANSDGYFNSTKIPIQAKLIEMLEERYRQIGSTVVIPQSQFNVSNPFKVWFGIRIVQLDVMEKDQVLRLSAWIKLKWFDDFLKWDPDEFGGVTHMVMNVDKIWTPDVGLSNSAEAKIEEDNAKASVLPNGRVYWSPHRIYKSACLFDAVNYPFDRHTCELWFQSLSRYNNEMQLLPYEISPFNVGTFLAAFEKSQEWSVLKNETEYHENPSLNITDVIIRYSTRNSLKFTITIQRRIGYTAILLLLPSILLGYLTLVIFCLPPERPDRHTLALSLFGSFMILLLILVDTAPPNAVSVPNLVIYYSCNMVAVVSSVFLSVFVVHISRRGLSNKRIPNYVKVIFIDYLSRILCLHKSVRVPFHGYGKRTIESVLQASQGPSLKMFFHVKGDLKNNIDIEAPPAPINETSNLQNTPNSNDTNISNLLKAQWRNVASVLDRLMILILFTYLTIMTIIYFPRKK